MYKKILSIILSGVCFLTISSTPINAKDEDLMKYAPSPKSVEINEYESIIEELNKYENAIKEKKLLSTVELDNYENLKNIKNDYPNFIYKQKELSIEELISQNYTDDQIQAIKNYDGSEEMTLRASASVSATLKLTKFTYKSSENRTYASAKFTGHWNGSPSQKFQDSIGIGITGSNARFARLGSSNYIKHADNSMVYNTYSKYYSMVGLTYKFGTVNKDNKIFKEFGMTYNAVADGKVTVMDYGAAYIHHYSTFSGPGLSIGISQSGSVSLGFSFTPINKGAAMWDKTYTRTSYL